jgi:enoyl-CoA hydratase
MTYETIILHAPEHGVARIELHRPKALNAINAQMMRELAHACLHLDLDDEVRCVVIHGSEKAFAAGADIKEMATATVMDMLKTDNLAELDKLRLLKKPVIAAVSGFALGGGCELAMICDMLVCSDTAKFGQPEIKIGVIPGAGGTQRLTRAVGKVIAMEMCLTGRMITAQEALQYGLVNKVVPVESYLNEAMGMATTIAGMPPIAAQFAKQAVLRAFDTTLELGLEYERKLFYMLFASEDMREGMSAFVEKRTPLWKGY